MYKSVVERPLLDIERQCDHKGLHPAISRLPYDPYGVLALKFDFLSFSIHFRRFICLIIFNAPLYYYEYFCIRFKVVTELG